jgi:hypothetical protein
LAHGKSNQSCRTGRALPRCDPAAGHLPSGLDSRHAGKRFFVMDRKRLVWFSLRHRGIKASKEIDRARRERIEG